jgi:hypothetical protein
MRSLIMILLQSSIESMSNINLFSVCLAVFFSYTRLANI